LEEQEEEEEEEEEEEAPDGETQVSTALLLLNLATRPTQNTTGKLNYSVVQT
jgi:hypothetical protein